MQRQRNRRAAQGKPAARRGRKARDLDPRDRSVAGIDPPRMVLMTPIRALSGALCSAAAVAAIACAPASAAALDTSCTAPAPALSQPFTSIGDPHWYTLAPGASYDAAAGWQLSGGAALVSTAQ